MDLIDNNGTVVPEAQFRANNPFTSFPAQLTQDMVTDFGYNILVTQPMPTPSPYFTLTQGGPELIDGVWTLPWIQNALGVPDAQALALTQLAGIRYQNQTAPITLNGVTLRATQDSLTYLYSAIGSLNGSTTGTVNFKAVTGWTTFNLSQLQAFLDAINAQIQKSFSNEYAHTQVIEGLTSTTDVAAHDMTTGW